jgi:hypothetical protein
MRKSLFWGGIVISIMGGLMYCFERFSAYISQGIILAGYTSHGTTVSGREDINIQLSTNELVPLFLVVGVILIIVSIIPIILGKEKTQVKKTNNNH